MNCPNCGNKLNPDNIYCTFCGTRVHNQVVSPSSTDISNSNRLQKQEDISKKNRKALIISLLGIIVAIAIATFVFKYINHHNEESLWKECVIGQQINDLKTYIDKYPDGEHSQEARKMLDKLLLEKDEWEKARTSNDDDYLRAFVRNHPNSSHLEEARSMLDDVVWNNAVGKNTKDAYKGYLDEFPEGKHIGEAQRRYEEKRHAELSNEERNNVANTLKQFLIGLEQWNEEAMLSSCNNEMSNFMGKSHASLNDVDEYYRYYKSNIDSIGFTSPAVEVKKIIRSDNRAEYKVSFSTTRIIRRNNSDELTTDLMHGQAVVDDNYRFIELSMDKVPQ